VKHLAQVLEMVFTNEGQKNFTISLNDPKTDLSPAEVKAAMDTIIAKNIFKTSGGDVIQVAGARIISKETTELQLV
jgi:hypothetical protein